MKSLREEIWDIPEMGIWMRIQHIYPKRNTEALDPCWIYAQSSYDGILNRLKANGLNNGLDASGDI